MKIKLLNADYSGCGSYRIIWPADHMRKNGIDATASPELLPDDVYGKRMTRIAKVLRFFLMFVPKRLAQKIDNWFFRFAEKQNDIVVYQRHAERQTFMNALVLKRLGTKVVFEVDDFLGGIDKLSPAKTAYDANTQEQMLKIMMMSDAVTVTTDYLKNILSGFNPNIYVLPNSLNPDLWNLYYEQRMKLKAKKSDKVVIGWMGSKTHLSDFMEVKDVLFNIVKTNPNVILKIVGFEELGLLFKEAIEPFKDRVILTPWKNNMFDYPSDMLQFDIGLCPLKNSRFNKAKSNLKWLEYSAMAIPTVATNIEPYKSIDDGVTGFLTSANNNYIEWERKLKTLIKSEMLRRKMGEAARAEVWENYNIKKNWKLWAKAYEEIIARPRLTSEKEDVQIITTSFLPEIHGEKSA
jgi:glycosyltransferase involved in cell wall biosynthesis